MLTWRRSKRLLGSPDLYRAALCQDIKKAEYAFERWLDTHQPDDIEYSSQKPLSLAWNRHELVFKSHAKAGVFTNIRRQAHIRAHANALLLPMLLAKIPEVPVIGLGEVYARWKIGSDQAKHLDHIDLGVRRQDMAALCRQAKNIGFSQNTPEVKSLYRSASVLNMRCFKRKVSIKIIGFHRPLPQLDGVCSLDNLKVFPYDLHLKVCMSTMSRLLRRPDQLLFDFSGMIKQSDRFPNALAVLSRRPMLRRLVHQIVGV